MKTRLRVIQNAEFRMLKRPEGNRVCILHFCILHYGRILSLRPAVRPRAVCRMNRQARGRRIEHGCSEQRAARGSVRAFLDVPQKAALLAAEEVRVGREQDGIEGCHARTLAFRAMRSG